MGLQAKK